MSSSGRLPLKPTGEEKGKKKQLQMEVEQQSWTPQVKHRSGTVLGDPKNGLDVTFVDPPL